MDNSNGVSQRYVTLNLRVEQHTLQLIDRAVAEVGGGRSRFIVEAACRHAEDILLDRRFFRADGEAFEALDRALEAPSESSKKALRDLVGRGRCWSL